MDKDELYKIFTGIVNTSAEERVYDAVTLPNISHKLGVSKEGYPKFFVYTQKDKIARPNIRGEFLSVEYDVKCNIVGDDNVNDSCEFSIVTLRSIEESLQKDFINILYLLLCKLGNNPLKKELSKEIDNLIVIFAALKRSPVKKIQGLWAELLVIEQSENPELTANAWHTDPSSKYDFSMGDEKIEVKSTSSEQRIHKFSLDQLNPVKGSVLLIASSVVRETAESESGLSVKDLYDRICARIDSTDTKIHIYDVMLNTIGNDFRKLNEVFFDYNDAKETLSFFDYRSVPRLLKSNVPDHVTEVKFASDLTSLEPITSNNELIMNTQMLKLSVK